MTPLDCTSPERETSVTDARLRSVVDLHFHPTDGAPFWLARRSLLTFDPRERIQTLDDLPCLGPLTRADLVGQPLQAFVPRSLWGLRSAWRLAETGGTTGRPLRCVFSEDEFRAAFVRPFSAAVRARDFPVEGTWAFVGPSGPHVIHQAARAFARDAGALEPVSVDFDPRWARSQTEGSFGARSYREHVVSQAVQVIAQEDARVLFSTPPVLHALATGLSDGQRVRVRGIHIGGMPLSAADRAQIQADYPEAVLLPAYGNSLAGIAPEMEPPRPDGSVRYAIPAGRLRLRVVQDRADDGFDAAALRADCALGERGRVVLDRIDPTFLLANLIERDCASLSVSSVAERAAGMQEHVLVDPGPAPAQPVVGGLY